MIWINLYVHIDFVPAVELCPNSGDLQFDFRIFSARLFYGKLENEEIKFEAQEDGTGSEIEELNNTFTEFRARQVECPKIQICIATNTGIAIVNLRSGETEFAQKFPGKKLDPLFRYNEKKTVFHIICPQYPLF